MMNNYYVNQYIRANRYSEYKRLLNYWKEKLPDQEIIYTVDTNPNDIEDIFKNDTYDVILIAAWLYKEDNQLEIEIFHNGNIDKGIINYLDILERRGDITIINSEKIK